MRITRAAVLAFMLMLPALPTAASDLEFKHDTPGQPPISWHIEKAPADAVVSAVVDAKDAYRGHASATMTIAGPPDGAANASLRTEIDVAPYRGKIVLLRAAMKTSVSGGGTAWLWIRGEAPSGQYRARIDTVFQKSPTGWKVFEAAGSISKDATRLVVALAQNGGGTSSIADVSLRVIDANMAGYKAPRPLTPQGLANLGAFARLLGYVRFFHPSDEAAAVDWNSIAIAGVQRVEGARDRAALIDALRAVFTPLAPTLRICATGGAVPVPSPALKAAPGATMVRWEHHGVFLGYSGGGYHSERMATTSPEPDAPFAADIGAGVSVLMPTTLYKDAKGTLPHTTAKPITPDKPVWFTPSGDDRATRLADVVLSWTVFQHFYPDFEEEPVDWRPVLDTTLQAAATDASSRTFADTLRRMLAALRDGHGAVYDSNGTILGLPVAFATIEGHVVVARVQPGTPLAPGDVVDRIDGEPIADAIARIAPTIAAATPQWRATQTMRQLEHRETADPVVLQIHRADGKPVDVSITPNPAAMHDLAVPTHSVMRELKPGVWYLDFSLLKDGDVKPVLKALASAKAIVFDMRGYPASFAAWHVVLAHITDTPLQSQRFLTPVATLPDRLSRDIENNGWSIAPQAPRFHAKCIFLTGGGAVSQSETLMGLVRDNHLGTIVGSTTAGTTGEINPFTVPGGYSLYWTGMRVLNLDGSRFIGVGISPDVAVEPTIAGIRAGRDEVLEKALSIAESN